jgi:hypothetical protein
MSKLRLIALLFSLVFAVASAPIAAAPPTRTLPATPDARRVEAAAAIGVAQWTAAVRSINGLPARGGFAAVPSSGAQLQLEEINPRWLHAGLNQIAFSPAPVGEGEAKNFHAEMRFLAEAINGELEVPTGRGGKLKAKICVAKPICPDCARELEAQGVTVMTEIGNKKYKKWLHWDDLAVETPQGRVTHGAVMSARPLTPARESSPAP